MKITWDIDMQTLYVGTFKTKKKVWVITYLVYL